MPGDKRLAFLPGEAGDRALRARLLAGEDAAFEEVYRLHGPAVLRFLTGVLGDAALVQDALQETFIAVFRNLRALKAVTRIDSWLFRVAIRRGLNALRARIWRALAEAKHETGPATF